MSRTESGRITRIKQPPSPKHEKWPLYENDSEYDNAEKMMLRGINPFTGEEFQDQEEIDLVWDSAYQHDEGAHHARFDRRWEQLQEELDGEDEGGEVEWE